MEFTEIDFTNRKQYKYTIKDKNISGYCYVKDEELYRGRVLDGGYDLLTDFLTSKELRDADFEEVTLKDKWDIKLGDEYFYTNDQGNLDSSDNDNCHLDRRRIAIGNACKDEDYMKKLAFRLSLLTRESKFADIYNTEPIDWNNKTQPKYFLRYKTCEQDFRIEVSFSGYDANVTYYTSKEVAEMALKEFGEDIKKLATWDIDKK